MGFKRVEKNRRSRRNQSRRDGTICSPARECREGCQANRVPKGRHNGEFSHYRLFSPCHRTSHAKCPSAGNSKHFTDATQICYLIAYVLIAIIKKKLQRDASLTLVYRFSPSSSLKKHRFHAPCSKLSQTHPHCHANQLILFDI